MEVLPHEHPLTLIDLNPEYPRDEVVYDDEEELIMKQDFRCPCGRCGQEINFYHRYYYTCDQCDYSLHKLCAELLTTLRHESHRDHALILCQVLEDKWCMCQVCTRKHDYEKDNFFHAHPLTLSYSFPRDDQKAKFDPRCKVCEERFDENLWIYKCEKCRFYVHTDCATTSKKASMNAIQLNPGTSAASKNYTDSNYPDLLHLPFPDQTAAFKHFCGESGSRTPFETNLTHPFHQHPLTLVDTTTSPSHDSMKMVEVLCNACVRPITNMSFYKCTDDGCNFVLHLWCTRLPTEVKMGTLRKGIRTLKLLPPVPFAILGVFRCLCCELFCSGFVYSDKEVLSGISYEVDVCCAFTPEYITHKSHPNHLLRKHKPSSEKYCRLCLSDAKTQFFYGCEDCNFYLHPKCALLWPDTIRHKYDKHPMSLRYFPVENYGGDYFCEVCEEEFNPNIGAFYHCDQCVYSIHLLCVEFIRQEATTWAPFLLDRGVHQYENVKSRIFTFKGHPHPLSLSRSTESDGECTLCGKHLNNYWIIFKCLQCKFAIDRDCFRKIE
ncbi:zinc finger, PHD-type, DC1 [Artemisia annua]|uniref:Zinc finger, PHD-type, DC1 n=1 Tax=Artemisia annua TaxID=35608 RepID=A0A2U1LHJ4_ARTAN|nr:zinc finger, PHD-type, DC1 [Artemisia annua]